ncbi:MAG: hypothetical protein N2423_05835, partial [Novosphingobium sp.]|nr:hypothetical protein [Novosphingobium sp.]
MANRAATYPGLTFIVLLLVAFALRFDTLGDPNLHGDEVFYHVVGLAMHQGALPYVDVWDRKPFGLFALSWLIAFVSRDMLAFQLAALAFAAATAWVIAMILRCWSTTSAGLLAGVAYLLWLAPLQGYGGQSPVFYNLFIALAALLVVRALPELHKGRALKAVAAAMLLAGCAITMKTTALIEAAFLGLWACWALWRSGAGARRLLTCAAIWAAIGAAPALLIAAGYWAIGHWGEYWQAMVLSNLDKPVHWPTALARLKVMGLALAPMLLIALPGLAMLSKDARGFVAGWLASALIGLAAVPNFYLHYALPLLVPLCVAAGGLLAHRPAGPAAITLLAILSLAIAPIRPGHAARSAAALDRLERAIRAHVGDGPLLLYDAPPQLYQRTGQPFITPLVFPTHLAHLIEKDVSHLSTLAETRRILALKPGAVVMATPPRNAPVNRETQRLVMAYVQRHCRLVETVPTLERQRIDMIAVWGDCRSQKVSAPPNRDEATARATSSQG